MRDFLPIGSPLASNMDYGIDGNLLRDNPRTTQDHGACQMGAELILKRIVKKLFNQLNELQPNELDDEFIYESSLTYSDYLSLSNQIQNDNQPLSCSKLNRMGSLLSNLISSATIKRPTQLSPLNNLIYTGTSTYSLVTSTPEFIGGTSTTHLFVILTMVCLFAWLVNPSGGYRSWKPWALSLFVVGFVEFCRHNMNQINVSKRLELERCANPTWLARMASLINYDYDNCLSATETVPLVNIAIMAMEYVSKLIFNPLVVLGESAGKAINAYSDSFRNSMYNSVILLPTTLLMLFVSITVIIIYGLKYCFMPPIYPSSSPSKRKNFNSINNGQNSKQKSLTDSPTKGTKPKMIQ